MSFIGYLRKHQSGVIAIAIILFVSLTFVSIYYPAIHQSIAWAEAIAGFGTLVFAIFIWYNAVRREWEDKLPKRMTVQFQYQGRNVMICYDGLLTNITDARTWALQIGQQISGCQKLKFDPYYNFIDQGIKKNAKNGKYYNYYVFTYFLTELPTPQDGKDSEKEAFKKSLETGCIEWYNEINPDNSISYKKGYNTTTQKINTSE